ncbi:hypothetical protein ACNKHU_05060 [Shigella flexneri]
MTDLGALHRVILLGLFATLLQAKGTLRLDKSTSIVADRESRNPFTPHYALGCLASVKSSAIAAHCHHQLG